MKLITEHTDDLRYISEDVDGERKLMIEGIFMQAEKQNRNGRVYPKDILAEAVEKYDKSQVSKGRAVGELGHPDSPTVNLDRVSHRIVELNWDGNNVMGRAQVLDTPMGKIVRGLMEGDVQLGVSTRGMGSLQERGGKTYVKDDFMLATVDIVQDPSAPEAFVNGIMEGVDYFIDNGVIRAQDVDGYRKTLGSVSQDHLAEAQMKVFKDFLNKF
jgi:hypothetical protein